MWSVIKFIDALLGCDSLPSVYGIENASWLEQGCEKYKLPQSDRSVPQSGRTVTVQK